MLELSGFLGHSHFCDVLDASPAYDGVHVLVLFTCLPTCSILRFIGSNSLRNGFEAATPAPQVREESDLDGEGQVRLVAFRGFTRRFWACPKHMLVGRAEPHFPLGAGWALRAGMCCVCVCVCIYVLPDRHVNGCSWQTPSDS